MAAEEGERGSVREGMNCPVSVRLCFPGIAAHDWPEPR
jgi:hypothetical protein